MQSYNSMAQQNELYHHGVKGMKWGVRRKRPSSGTRVKVKRDYDTLSDQEFLNKYSVEKSRYAKRMQKWDGQDNESRPLTSNSRNAKEAYKAKKKEIDKRLDKAYDEFSRNEMKNGRRNLDAEKRYEDAADKWEADRRSARQEYKKFKKDQRAEIKKKTSELNKSASLGEKLTYSEGTRKLAAKYIVDNNMSVSEATSRAKKEAWRNSAIFVAGFGAVTVGSLLLNK